MNIDYLRLRISDKPRVVLHEVAGVGDAQTRAFSLSLFPIVTGSESVIIDDGGVAQALAPSSEYTLDYETGLLALADPPVSLAKVLVSYKTVVFSDSDLNSVIDNSSGNIDKATRECVRMLLASRELFLKYTLGQEAVDPAQIRQALVDLLEDLNKGDSGGLGTVVWADTPELKATMAPFLEND